MKKLFILLVFLFIGFQSNASQWLTSYDEALSVAQAENKLIIIDFWAPWCGPCKTMDRKVWSDGEIQDLQKNFVNVKIDIDRDKITADKYSVQAIPAVMITDSWGNILVKGSYMEKSTTKRLLASFPNNVQRINDAFRIMQEDDKNAHSNLALGEAYQLYIPYLKGSAKSVFLKQSDKFLGKTEKLCKKSKDDLGMCKSALLKKLNLVYRGKSKKVISEIEKMLSKGDVDPIYKGLAYYIMIEGCRDMKDLEKEKKYYELLTETKGGKPYLKKLEGATRT